MSREKQIEEMAKCCTYYHNGECCADATNISDCDLMCEMFGVFANLTANGYRKQSEGEWIWKKKIEPQAQNRLYCSVCDDECLSKNNYYVKSNFCPNCGAKMKGV